MQRNPIAGIKTCLQTGRYFTETVVGFSSSLSFPWLPCLLQNFFSSIHPELLKSVVIPSMIVNLGLQLSTAQSHLLVFLPPYSALSFLPHAFSLGSQVRAWFCSTCIQNLTFKGQKGDFRWWTLKELCLPSSTEQVLFSRLCIQVRELLTWEAKKEGGIFFFPIMH